MMLHRLWKRLKMSRKFRLGPVTLVYHFERAVNVTRNSGRRLRRLLRSAEPRPSLSAAPPHGLSELNMVAADESPAAHRELALIVGVGPGLGEALAKKLARANFDLVLASRNAARLDSLAGEICANGGRAYTYGCDATSESSVKALFGHVQENHGIPNLVVYSLQYFCPGSTIDMEAPAFEAAWRHNCLGSFLVAREAARAMLTLKRGTIVLVGSTSSLIGRAAHLNLAVGKFGQRALAQVLAREVWPSGIHVTHLIIDADIREGVAAEYPQSNPEDIADMVLVLHRQSKSAWTSELDMRPWNERFWEHC